jgi:hypothetical protein
MTTTSPHRRDVPGATWTRRAWWSLLAFVPCFVLAFVVGEGLISALGYPSGDGQAPWWAMLTAAIPALVVFVAPAVLVTVLGRRARRAGDVRGRWPVAVAWVVASVFLLLNGASALLLWLA